MQAHDIESWHALGPFSGSRAVLGASHAKPQGALDSGFGFSQLMDELPEADKGKRLA